jgi:diacylglycerol kinase (ATP)
MGFISHGLLFFLSVCFENQTFKKSNLGDKMLVLINPKASGGTALKKWKSIEPRISKIINSTNFFFLNGNIPMQTYVKAALSSGETQFVSAGGDGTLNQLLNLIMKHSLPEQLNNITIGAVGIGSSNDFYKPFTECEKVNNIPVKINFDEPELRDVGKITFENDGIIRTKFFLINSSIGIAAEANYFFNNPDTILSSLKSKNASSAILYAAIKEILIYKNFDTDIISKETGKIKARITNLGIVKNPNFSGSMNYGYKANYESGLFNIHLCYDMNLRERLKLFLALSSGRFDKVQKTKSWTANKLKVESEKPFTVEFDGEIITACSVEFSIRPKYLRICR